MKTNYGYVREDGLDLHYLKTNWNIKLQLNISEDDREKSGKITHINLGQMQNTAELDKTNSYTTI